MSNVRRRSVSENKFRPYIINKFGGINLNSPEEAGKTAYAADMLNFRVTADGKLQKRGGYSPLASFTGNVRCMWFGTLGGADALYCVAGNGFYRCCGDGTKTLLGTLPTSFGKCLIFYYRDKLYILDTAGYYRWNEISLEAVFGYVPVVKFASAPSYQGAPYESYNIISKGAIKRFQGLADKSDYIIETEVTSIDEVKIGEQISTDWTYSSVGGITTVVIPSKPSSAYIIDIKYTMKNYHNPELYEKLLSCRCFTSYGIGSDTHVFFFGGTDKNLVFSSEYENKSQLCSSAEYFPVNAVFRVGDSRYAVTGAIWQADNLMIFKENEVWSATQTEAISNTGIISHSYCLQICGSIYGAGIFGGVKQIENVFYSLMPDGIYKWKTTEIFGERIANRISDPVGNLLSEEFLKNAVTYCGRREGEFWVAYGGIVWIYNTRFDTWYRYGGIKAEEFIEISEGITAFCDKNTIYAFNDGIYADNEAPFTAYWRSKSLDMGYPDRRKSLHRVFVNLEPSNGGTVSASISGSGSTLCVNTLDPPNPICRIRSEKRIKISRCDCAEIYISACGAYPCGIDSIGLSFAVGGQ